MSIKAPQLQNKAVNAVRNMAVSFAGQLDAGELLSGTPTITEATETLTLSNKVISTSEKTINGETVPTAEAVLFQVASGGTAGTTYTMNISIGTNSTPAQTLVGEVDLKVISG